MSAVLLILFLHWVSDFVLQDERWALGKSKNYKDLLSHTIVYSTAMFIGMIVVFLVFTKYNFLGSIFVALLFALVTFIFHTITDFITSRIVARKFANKEYGSPIPNFGAFTIIGADQMLHFTQLLLLYKYLV